MNNNKKIIDITTIQYYEKIDTIFTLRNDYFMCPPFNSYKILNDYQVLMLTEVYTIIINYNYKL